MEKALLTPARIELQKGHFFLPVRPVSAPNEPWFVADIYSTEGNVHPDLHLGWWRWPAEVAVRAEGVRFAYRSAEDIDVALVLPDGEYAPDEQWVNPDYQIGPLQQINLLWFDTQHAFREQAQVSLAVVDQALLQAYYANNVERYAVNNPFLEVFHKRRLDVMERLFQQYIRPGSQVLDVGSGHSFFYLTRGERWPFQVTCLDLDRHLMKQIAPERRSYNWLSAAMQELPFVSRAFDALYAGEVIEHVPDGDAALAEWNRVLRPGATLIVTTPNRERLLNRLNHTSYPVSIEHLVEFTCEEMRAMFERNGFDMLHYEGIYVELLSLWRQRRPYIDPLNKMDPLRRHVPALKPLMLLGRPLPWLAFNLVFVGRKRAV